MTSNQPPSRRQGRPPATPVALPTVEHIIKTYEALTGQKLAEKRVEALLAQRLRMLPTAPET